VAHHDLTDLIRTAAGNEFVVDPEHDDRITVPTITESGVQLVINLDHPALANDGLA
jgi:hypothetical protein